LSFVWLLSFDSFEFAIKSYTGFLSLIILSISFGPILLWSYSGWCRYDLNFLSTFITRTYNNTFSDQDKQYIQWFDNLTPLLQGNVFLSYFDKTYNNKASKLRQVYYKRYVDGLRNGVTIENLLSPNSENYIAKDIKNLLPKTSDLGSIVQSIAEETNQSEVPPRLEGETALEYEKRTMSQ